MSTAPPLQHTSKLPGIELLRFAAAFGVLILHYQHFAYFGDMPRGLVRDQLPFAGWLWPLYLGGQYGVWVFWCISGFIFHLKYRDEIAALKVSSWRFFVLRFSRLYPLHVVTLIVVAVLQSVHWRLQGNWFVYQDNNPLQFLLQLGLATGWGPGQGDSFNGPIWSVSAEVLVYAIFFLSLRYVSRSALLNVVAIGVCLNITGQVFSCLAFFYAGGLAAIARCHLAKTDAGPRWTIIVAAAALCVALAVWYFQVSFAFYDWLIFLLLAPATIFVLSGDVHLPAPLERAIETAGNMTYASYLLHFPFQIALAVGFACADRAIPYYESWFLIGYVTMTLAASYVTFRFFEMPAQAFLRERLLPAVPLVPARVYAKMPAA